jgi:tryptophanyl-tRNA synthetase
MKRLLSGLQPSGELTIGNYIGSIDQFIKYENEYESFIFIPDLHAITVEQDPKMLQERIRKNLALYIACGLDPEKNIFFIQSENLYHANLSWILECNTYFGELSRMTQFKDKTQKKQNFSCGLLTYPILMASDILLYDADVVPVGLDQKQHVELCRDIAERFYKKYGKTFVIPEPILPKVGASIKDLQEPTRKMSKSAENKNSVIFLLDREKDIRKKIMGAVTDSDSIVKFDEVNKPGISNLITIYSVLTKNTISGVEKEFADANYGTFKKAVADVVVEVLTRIQKRYEEIINSTLIDDILDKGRNITNEIAKKKYEEVRHKVGLGRS